MLNRILSKLLPYAIFFSIVTSNLSFCSGRISSVCIMTSPLSYVVVIVFLSYVGINKASEHEDVGNTAEILVSITFFIKLLNIVKGSRMGNSVKESQLDAFSP